MKRLSLVPTWAQLSLLVAIYFGIGSLYVVITPLWQAPDEPAHYNYIAHVAETRRLPVLGPGDFPMAYLEEIKAAGFPADMPVDPLRYEAWQPPLYYLLATPAHLATRAMPLESQVRAIRFFSLLIGAALIPLIYYLILEGFPGRHLLALGSATVVMAIPMHMAMLAAINNDGLAEVLLTGVLLATTRIMRRGPTRRCLLALGAWVGLCLITKNTAALAVPVALLGVWIATARIVRRPTWVHVGRNVAYLVIPALLISAGWYIRNMVVYGLRDPLIWRRHAQVVAGQLTRAEYMASRNGVQWLGDLILTTFRSFWGQFGWMAVPMEPRVYIILGSLSALAILGGAFLLARIWRARMGGQWADSPLTQDEIAMALPLVMAGILTVGLYLWYNREFVQFQGRYLFPVIASLSLAFTASLWEALQPTHGKLLAALFGLAAWLLLGMGMAREGVDKVAVGWLTVGAIGLLANRQIPGRYRPWIQVALYAGLVAFTAAVPFLYIAPYL